MWHVLGFELLDFAAYVAYALAAQYAEDYLLIRKPDGDYDASAVEFVDRKDEVTVVLKDKTEVILPQFLPADNLELSFDIKENYATPKRLNVVLSDYKDENKKLVFSIAASDAT